MKVRDFTSISDNSIRLRIIKNQKEIYTGFLGNLSHSEEIEAILAAEVKKIKAIPEIRHKKWREKNLMPPLEPEELPQYSFSDLQMQLYYTIEI